MAGKLLLFQHILPDKPRKLSLILTLFLIMTVLLVVFHSMNVVRHVYSQTSTDPVIATAGDISCGSDSTSSACLQNQTAQVISNISPNVVLPLGDTQYENGSYDKFFGTDARGNPAYDGSWGRFKSITRPAVGNHEYLTNGASGYFDYFNGVGIQNGIAGDRTKGYYAYDLGAWRVYAINSNCSKIGGCNTGSAQEQWLRADLSTHTTSCSLMYMHHPLYTSQTNYEAPRLQPLFQAFYDYGGDVVLTGHSHFYERYAPQDPSDTSLCDGTNTQQNLCPVRKVDQNYGIRQFIVGTGGRNSYGASEIEPNSQIRSTSNQFGVLKMTLHNESYDWQFLPAAGSTFTDSGSGNCHGSPLTTPMPTMSPTPVVSPPGSYQPSPPYYATFFYNWFKNPATDGVGQWAIWKDSDILGPHSPPSNWYSNYLPQQSPGTFDPSTGLYSSNDYTNFKWQVAKLKEAKQSIAIASWWGQGDRSDVAFEKQITDFMNRSDNPYPNLRWTLYYECEAGPCISTTNPSVSQIVSDLNYIAAKYTSLPGYLKVNGKPVIFVYADSTDSGTTDETCSDNSMAARWNKANQLAETQFYINLKVFSGYTTSPCQPDSWHQYAPAVRSDQQSSYSYAVSPGFWKVGENIRLDRDFTAFTNAVKDMVASNVTWKLTTTWNEWGEGSSVEPGVQVVQVNGATPASQDFTAPVFGNLFVDALNSNLPDLAPSPPLTKPGDANGDNLVNEQDYLIWKSHYNQSVSGPPNGDFDSNGIVDGRDYVIWLTNYGT